MQNIIGILVSYIFIAIIIILSKFFEKYGKEFSRKFVHITLSNWWFIAMYFFDNVFWVCLVPMSFVIINYISYKKQLISVMEREEQEGLGTVYYALSLLILSILTFGITKRTEIGLCSILIMGYGDGLASVVGKSIKSYEYTIGKTKKTVAGILTMFIITFIVVSIFLFIMQTDLYIIKSIFIAIVLTVVEAISIKGTDNLTLPLVACLILHYIM